MVVITRGMKKRSWRWKSGDGGERKQRHGSDVIAKVFRSRSELRLKNEEKNFDFNAGGEDI